MINIDSENITDKTGYLQRMEKAMEEKLWFRHYLDSLPGITTIIDFGCANEALLGRLPDKYRKYGVEVNPEFRKECNGKGIKTFSDIKDIKANGDECVIIMSSVIHEIFSYMPERAAYNLMQDILDFGAAAVFIRDMAYTDDSPINENDQTTVFRATTPDEVSRLLSFDSLWGFETQTQLMHYLLKCKYVDNWERELKENYLPIHFDTLKQLITDHNYSIQMEKLYTNEYIHDYCLRDYHYDLKLPTHFLLFVSKNRENERRHMYN